MPLYNHPCIPATIRLLALSNLIRCMPLLESPLPPSNASVDRGACARCGRALAHRSAFRIDGERRCLRDALRHAPMLRRSALAGLIVGTVLVAINQGNHFAAGMFPIDLLWKIPLTYLVPFCVATWGALSNSRV
jgi:hypothetical protein